MNLIREKYTLILGKRITFFRALIYKKSLR